MGNLPEWMNIGLALAQVLVIPMFGVVWRIHGRISTIEGKVEVMSKRR